MDKYNRKDVIKVQENIYGDANMTITQAINTINYNAEILKQVLDRLDILEVGIEAMRKEKQ